MNIKEAYLVTSDNKYVINPGARRYSWVPINGDISQGNLSAKGKKLKVVSVSDTQFYLAMGTTSQNNVLNPLSITHGTKNLSGESHNVNFIGSSESGTKPLTILPGLSDTFHLYSDAEHATAPNIAIEHSGGEFLHVFTAKEKRVGEEIIIEEIEDIDELRKKVPSRILHSLLKGPWKIIE